MSRRLGERSQYGAYLGRLGEACHADFHDWKRIYEASRFECDQPTPEEPLPAGPASKYLAVAGKRRGRREESPPQWLIDALAHTERLGQDLRRVAQAREKLPLWGKRGNILYQLVIFACVLGAVRPTSRGWRHVGRGRAQAEALFRSAEGVDPRRSYERALEEAWEVIGVLAVEADILADAEKAEAVDAKVLAWAREQGLVS